MRTTLILSCLFLVLGIRTQSFAQTLKLTNTIENCATLLTDGFVATQVYPGAIEYEFELKNVTTANTQTLVSPVNSIQLNAFSSIITYSSSYLVKVRVKYSGITKYSYTTWSDPCEFNLGLPPKDISITNENCGTTITDLNDPIYASPVYNASCYTFHVTNVTTGQSYESPCTTNNFLYLSSVGIPLLPGDEVQIAVTFTVHGERSEISKPCQFVLNHPRKFCAMIPADTDFGMANKKAELPGTKSLVGNNFILDYADHNTNASYPAALWDPYSAQVISTVTEVLEDVDAFLDRNMLSNCGVPNQRMIVSVRPYEQSWVTANSYANALAVANQSGLASDLNYAGQGCPLSITNVILALNNAPVGTANAIGIGYIYINPAVGNFNLNYPAAPTGSEYDLYSVILHELTHILGINIQDYRFSELLYAGAVPLSSPGIFNCNLDPNYNTLSTSGCASVSCIGNYTNDPVHAPSVFDYGSSLSHFPDDCLGTPLGNNVMNPGISMGQQKRFYHQREVNALQDLGYNFTNPFNGVNYTLHNTPYVVGVPDGMLVQPVLDELTTCDLNAYQPIVHSICSNWPLNLTPLTNDINAVYIKEAVVKTGNANASVSITGANNDQLNFTATVPGIYTIGYIPANGNRMGIPTYIQINVPACSDSDLGDVTCNDSPDCNQICLGEKFENTLIYGDFQTSPMFYPDGSFEFRCRRNYNGLNEPIYSSVFFWVDADQSEDYTLSFNRTYTETGSTSPNPDVKTYAYLVKSSDMLNGQYSQTSNYFASLPANKQLVYEELFTANSYSTAPVSFCFTANNEYDMLIFYDEQVTNYNIFNIGKVKIQNLEFLKKEVPDLQKTLTACLPQTVTLGETVCAAATNTFTWTSQNNTVLSTGPVYSMGTVTADIIDQYTLTMTYPALPVTVITPAQNASCNVSKTIDLTLVKCCDGATQPIVHPMTCNSAGRTFGYDVDGDNNGAVYYSGAMDPDITFDNQTVSCVSPGAVEGFLVKFDDYCLNWLVRTPFLNSKLEVSDNGRVFYLGGTDNSSRYRYLANFSASNGSVVWSWNVNPSQAQITDFALDETAGQIIVTGRMITASFSYSGTPITGTTDDIFVMRLNYSGTYIGHTVIAANGATSESRVAVNNSNLFIANAVSSTQWKLSKLNYSTLAVLSSPAPATITSSGGNFVFNVLEYDASGSVMAEVVNYTNVVYNGTTILSNSSGLAKLGYIKVSGSTLTTPFASVLSDVDFAYGSTQGADMDVLSGKAVFAYKNTIGEMHVKAIMISSGATLWDKVSVGVNAPLDWLAAKGVKFTPSGIYNTGCFWKDIAIDNTYSLSTVNPNTTSFYGIKYNGISGAITALAANNEAAEQESSNVQLQTTMGLNTVGAADWVSIFPNPGKGLFTVKAEGNYHITVRDIHGKIVDQYEGADQSKFDISERSNGMYLLEITGDRGTQIFKLLKE